MTAPFNRAAAEQRLGPLAVQSIRELVDAAPPLRMELRMQLQAVFDSARPAVEAERPLAA
ncbi:hypothetical protein J7F03_20555 [Streptomyces sp. ISL-43]|uniref:hypothetical protein n=1 Tax=Streptomyces sp. ISL-43 TaxID=2819183 RepID=UPI001BE5C6F3|nr:hypothetical protein [Streptomyces sp. ISL-43]MBT2449435.1 hypothetical protein [Streptomyces sp. ISL-43]